ncbi:putative glycosyltransferase [Rhodovulum sp. PH10]|nr:putative glycosyltransferase [Rhodovulum sp. PH10]
MLYRSGLALFTLPSPGCRTLVFIHQNIPAQFRYLAPAMAASGHRVIFITNGEAPPPRGVYKAHYKIDAAKESPEIAQVRYASRVAKTLLQLKNQHGVVPDLMIGHSSWGELMFVRDVFPKVPLLAYFEWFHHDELFREFDPDYDHNPNAPFVLRMKNVPNYVAGDICSAGISPTYWQYSTFPRELQSKINVIHDGVDTQAIRRPAKPALRLPDGRLITRDQEVVTYVARGLEPVRGIRPVFRAFAELLRKRPNAQVIVIGGEKTSYGNPLPEGETHKQQMLAEVDLDLSRVHFLGRVPYQTFLGALYVSRAHVYFTYPFILSWSMMEAMAAECLVIGSRTSPVEEVIRDGHNGILVDFHDHAALAARLDEALAHPDRFEPLRREARRTILERYDLHGICLPRQKALIDSLR